jgi:hypothetical protein
VKIPGIDSKTLNPTWPMRVRGWLDMKTLKPVYSVETRHPEFKVWLAIYTTRRGLKRFKTRETAQAFINEVRSKPCVAAAEA